jgi:outer membrane immunogenic protein
MKWGAVIGGVALAALTSLPASLPARAADMTPVPQRAATSGYIPAQFFWTGFYIGAEVGYAWGTTTFADPFFVATGSPSLSGPLVGGIAGINYQIGSVVIGVEGDFTGSWSKGSTVDTAGDILQTQVFWTSSITGRLGWAFDRLLIFGKGGVGFDFDKDTVTLPTGIAAAGSVYHAAWTVGGGVEYAITEHWTGRIEYDFFKFPTKGLSVSGPAGTASGNIGLNFNELKFIGAYKF